MDRNKIDALINNLASQEDDTVASIRDKAKRSLEQDT